jgi:hypothetical protein
MASDRARVSGRVVDANGAAIADATIAVRATGERATADRSGAFVLDVPANTTLTLEATSANMAPTLLPQFMLTPDASAEFEIPLVDREHLKSLVAMGANTSGGAIAIALKSMSGATGSAAGATIEISPSNLARVMYAPELAGLPDPDPSLTAIPTGANPIVWAVGVQPHLTTMTITLRGASQLAPPYSIEDVMWPGTFTVDAGALTLLTLFTP